MPKNLKFANNAQGADYARILQRKGSETTSELQQQLNLLIHLLEIESKSKNEAYFFILKNGLFDQFRNSTCTI